MEIQQGHWYQHIYSGPRHHSLYEGLSKKPKKNPWLLTALWLRDEQNTVFAAVVSIIEKDGDIKSFRMCNFKVRGLLRICNNTAATVVFLSISQTGITLDTGKAWPGNSIWLIVLTSELPAMSCHIGDLNFLLTKTPDPQVHKEPNVIRPSYDRSQMFQGTWIASEFERLQKQRFKYSICVEFCWDRAPRTAYTWFSIFWPANSSDIVYHQSIFN